MIFPTETPNTNPSLLDRVLIALNIDGSIADCTIQQIKDLIGGGETTTTILQKIGDGSKIDSTYLPSYVDDVIEVSTYSNLPVTGETGKIYIVLTGTEANREYRWSGTTYVEIKDSGESQATLGALVFGASEKTNPADTDMFGIMDSAASNVIKKFSWSNLKSNLKTYFDSLYQVVLVSGTNIKTINGNSLLGSGNIVISGGGATTFTGTIPGTLTADANAQYQWRNNTGSSITISNVAIGLGKPASGSGAAFTVQIYKSSGTASDGINTNAVALFGTAIALGTANESLTNVPTTATVEAGRTITVRITSSAGATNLASDASFRITYT